MSRSSRLSLLILAVFVLLMADQLTKLWVYFTLTPGESTALWGPIDLTLVFNRSNAFGIVPDVGEATRWVLAALNVAVASALAYLVWRREGTWAAFSGCAFIIAGAVGNAVDRIWLGAVIDMFDASQVGFIWVFNVADVLIDIGIGLWLVDTLLGKAENRPAQPASTCRGP